MKKKSTLIALFMALCTLLTVGTIVRADESERLSLGYSALTPAANDAKKPSPSALTVKYGFGLLKDVKPYVGTGLAYILPSETKPGENPARIKTGVAGQAGLKIDLGVSSSLNIDYKYLRVTPDQTRTDSGSTPQSIGIGLEIKF
jgi:outer membrane protein W